MPDYGISLLLVNDGSKDGTLKVMRELAARDERVQYLSFSRNFGKEAAMYAGFCNAKGDYVAVMDADMQDPPSLLPEMLQIFGNRRIRQRGHPPRYPRRRAADPLFLRADVLQIDQSHFRGGYCGRRARFSPDEARNGGRHRLHVRIQPFFQGIFGWIGFKTKWLPYKNVERVAGETKWSFFKLFKYSLDGIVNFSQAPLSIASVSGLILTAIAFFMILFVVIRRLIFGDPVAGWASTVCIILFIGGVQLLCMGIMGQYLAKTYLEVKNRPHFIISETNDKDAKRIG